ncbi:hypothetical protein [Streptomyces hydrogenans]|uniref:hypothetical protein n=1 Tax=Streptomyces hydrogenans TaxID=1873719 RepID=UPI0036F162AE
MTTTDPSQSFDTLLDEYEQRLRRQGASDLGISIAVWRVRSVRDDDPEVSFEDALEYAEVLSSVLDSRA